MSEFENEMNPEPCHDPRIDDDITSTDWVYTCQGSRVHVRRVDQTLRVVIGTFIEPWS